MEKTINSKYIFGTLIFVTTIWVVSGIFQSAQGKPAKVSIKRTTGGNAEGTNHLYNSGDTLTLYQVAEAFGGLVYNFNYYIWSRIGPENEGS